MADLTTLTKPTDTALVEHLSDEDLDRRIAKNRDDHETMAEAMDEDDLQSLEARIRKDEVIQKVRSARREGESVNLFEVEAALIGLYEAL